MSENEFSGHAELDLGELDAVTGGVARAVAIELEGQVVDVQPSGAFRAQLDDGKAVTCCLSGQLRSRFIRVRPGDKVKVEMNLSDSSRGRITYRY
jgi:translation initiation factor IF-1